VPITAADALAAYGRAMGKVQVLEQLMRVALGEQDIRRMERPGAKPHMTVSGEQLLRMDFGKLEQRICGKFKFDEEMTEVMADARGFRNYLAHQFWIHHLTELNTPRGAAIVHRHAVLMERQIDWVSEALVELTGVDAKAYTEYMTAQANGEEALAGWESQLDQAEAVFAEVAKRRARK